MQVLEKLHIVGAAAGAAQGKWGSKGATGALSGLGTPLGFLQLSHLENRTLPR